MGDPFEEYYLRRRAYELVEEGKTVGAVALDLGVSVGFVSKWVARGRSGKGFHDRPRRGRPRKIPDDLSKKEKALLKRKREGSSERVAMVLRTKYHVDISGRSVRRHASELHLKYRIRKRKPRLTERDKARRLAFAKKRRPHGFFEKIWWSDEKAFVFHQEPRGQWVECMDEVEPRERDLVEKTVRVWGAISAQGRTKLHKIPTNWTSDQYVAFLKKKGMKDIRRISGEDFIFQQDGDGAHRGKVVQEYFRKSHVPQLDDFPVRSPDITPIENRWGKLTVAVGNRNYTTLTGLYKVLQEEWANISEEEDRKLCLGVPKRLKLIIERDGAITKY